jgi:putative glutamine transport system permease protein
MYWLFNPSILKFLALGLVTTLELAVVAIFFSFIGGVLLALGRLSPIAAVRWLCTIYIEGMRALPVLLVIFFCYYALPRIINIPLQPFTAGAIAMSVFTSALVAEIVRAGILAVPKGLTEAALSQGMRPVQILRLITLPIAIRQMMPALVAQFVTLLKDTSLTAVINIVELLKSGQLVYTNLPPYQPIPVFALVAVIYFVCNFGLASIGRRLEITPA